MKLNEKVRSRIILGGIISVVLVLGIVLFQNPMLMNNIFGAALNTTVIYNVENGLETEDGTISGTSIILEYGQKQTGPNTIMSSGEFYIEYQGSNFNKNITLLVEGIELDLDEVTITSERIGLRASIEALEPVTFELINNSEDKITIDQIVVSRFANQAFLNYEPGEVEAVPEEILEVDLEEPITVEATLTFLPNQLILEGDGTKTNVHITLRPGATKMGPNTELGAGTWRVTYHGSNLRASDIIAAFQFDPYISFDLTNLSTNGNTLTYTMIVPINITSLDLLYTNIGTNNVIINRIVLERLSN